jgi:hypothetical protein
MNGKGIKNWCQKGNKRKNCAIFQKNQQVLKKS